MAIKCCYGCVPPKRNPWCHSTCPEYAEQKEKHDKETAAEREKKRIEYGLNSQYASSVIRATKANRKKG